MLLLFSLSVVFVAAFTLRYGAVSAAGREEGPGVATQPDIIGTGGKPGTTIGEHFDGEEFSYTMGFWWFKKAAVGKIEIHKQEDGLYRITLAAETLGFIGFVTSYRKDIYDAFIEEVRGGKRFRTVRFEKDVIIGKKLRKSSTFVDYKKGVYRWTSWKDGKVEQEGEEPLLPGEFYDDPLTGFYNFRFGVYGDIEEGREYHIPTFRGRKEVKPISVRIASHKEKAQRLNPDSIDYLADVVIDKELFGSQTGVVEIHFTKELIPTAAVAKDLMLFGDVRGKLVEMKSRTASPLKDLE